MSLRYAARLGKWQNTLTLSPRCLCQVSLGLDENDSTQQNVEHYEVQFEAAFITATELYYRKESDAFVAANPVTDYMRKAETRLREEDDRVEMYLHPTTRSRLIKKCEAVLISAHAQLLWDEFDKLLEAEKGDGELPKNRVAPGKRAT